MATEVERTEVRQMPAIAPPPLRGTQSFVGVMAQVWRRPALTAIELLWRWMAAGPMLLLAWFAGSRALRGVPFDARSLEEMTLFKPTEAAAVVGHQVAITLPHLWPIARWWAPLSLLLWTAASAWGRTAIWRRLDPRLRASYRLTGLLGLLRSLILLAVYGAWGWGLFAAANFAVLTPAARGAEPNLVLLMALAVAGTLVLFMLWSLVCWVLDAAPLFALLALAGNGSTGTASIGTSWRKAVFPSLRAAWQARALRPKLIETNLVMGIIKVALLVLAMVFSACPLPFATVETTTFLAGWWSFVGLLYLVFSDLFQVIRRAAYLRLFEALVTPESDITRLRAGAS